MLHCSSQDWIQAVRNRSTGLLTQYKGKFRHYDGKNEVQFYQLDKLGKGIRANIFKIAHQRDPSAFLLVNDNHVEDGNYSRLYPEKSTEQIFDLQEQGAPVGGIGVQGYIDSLVGPIVCSALDKMGAVGIPVWFTELDVSSVNEYVGAEDSAVMLREAFAHPAVGRIMLWGFWDLFMSRDNAEGEVKEAGKRFLCS